MTSIVLRSRKFCVIVEHARHVCHLYFASLVMLQNHTATHKQQSVKTKLVLSVKVAARRQSDMMVIIANAENVEWQEDHLTLAEQTVPEKDPSHNSSPCVNYT